MRTFMLLGVLAMVGCGASGQAAAPGPNSAKTATADNGRQTSDAAQADGSKPVANGDGEVKGGGEPADNARNHAASGTWVGASAESELLMTNSGETFLGVWVDAPEARPNAVKPPIDLALVIDNSGSMAGEKIDQARTAARQLVNNLTDGDIVSIDIFSDAARSLVAPTVLNSESRERLLGAIAHLGTGGSTNMFEGLSLGEAHVAQAPPSHTVRRVVVISDGIANVGPSSPEALGALAERGLRFRAQVTSLGVGNEYDEHTLNALALRSSGRLYHISEPREMASILKREVGLLASTVASDAFVEVVPAPGVQLIAAEGIRSETGPSGSLRIPLGALYAGQHREALVRVRVNPSQFENASAGAKPLASVRLRFHDPNDGDLERIQEVVARVGFTKSEVDSLAHVNARTKSIVAITEAAKLQMQAAQAVNRGQFVDADKELAAAEEKLVRQARDTKDDTQKKRLESASASIGASRRAASAVQAAPKAAQRDEALQLNKSGMGAMGF